MDRAMECLASAHADATAGPSDAFRKAQQRIAIRQFEAEHRGIAKHDEELVLAACALAGNTQES